MLFVVVEIDNKVSFGLCNLFKISLCLSFKVMRKKNSVIIVLFIYVCSDCLNERELIEILIGIFYSVVNCVLNWELVKYSVSSVNRRSINFVVVFILKKWFNG